MPEREPHVIRVSTINLRDRNRAAPPLGQAGPTPQRRSRDGRAVRGRGAGLAERLLRDCALCCAAALAVLALGNIRQPWAQTASATVREAVTMDLDESLGRLRFVRNLLPESALVFWNMGSGTASYREPATGRVMHAWKQSEPWLQYACEAQSVVAAAAGEVMAITQGEDAYMVRVRHEEGTETLYGDLLTCIVREGEALQTGQIIGTVGDTFFFELRKDGQPLNPSGLLRAP
ncbi:MAG: M23 family metallopeptidase [Oscillospiraceae bacterium]|nr:M23 family metallopeptidase [Oscillospiraceae bacterium]